MKKIYLFLSLLFVAFLNTSCTVLQWRKTDNEIQQKFTDLKIESDISYFQVDSLGINIRIQEIQTIGKNVNLIFIHGAPSSISTWESYLTDPALIAKANMYAIDRPGYGYSNFGKAIKSIDEQAQIMSAVINSKKLENIIVIGSSYGGPIAARIGVLNSNIKAVVMISPAIDPENEKDIWASRFTQWKLTRWLTPTAYRVAGDEKSVHANELSLVEKDWKNLDIPILHFHGDIDDIVPFGNLAYSKKTFQKIKVIPISDKGHELAWVDSEMIIDQLLNLIHQLEVKN